jgi:hypothetical protein
MCRSIQTLFNVEPPVTDDEIRAAAVQYVRKISGFQSPSRINEATFAAAVEEITAASRKLLRSLETKSSPRERAARPQRS